jgi:tRNA dimethylallyltransferase
MRDTRRYAKRQLSWFRRDKRIKWIALDRCKGPTAAVQAIFKTAPELKIP